MYLLRKSIKRSIALLLFTSFFGAPNFAQESFYTESRKEISVDKRKSLFSAFKNSNIDNISRNNLISKGFEKYQMVKKSNENEKIFKLIDNYFKIRSLWE